MKHGVMNHGVAVSPFWVILQMLTKIASPSWAVEMDRGNVQRSERVSSDTPADLVFRGGSVLTMDSADRRVSALAVRHGRIVGLGSDEDVAPLIGRRTRVVELSGRALLPGINDSHLHGSWLGAMWPKTLFGAPAPDGDSGAQPDFAHGEAEAAQAPAPLVSSAAERRAAILAAADLLASLGITSYTEPGLGPGENHGATGCFGQAVFDEYVALEAEGKLRARVNVLMLFGELDGPSHVHDYLTGLRSAVRETDRPSWLRVAGVKIFADGIPPMNTAWIHNHYADGSSGELLVGGYSEQEREQNLRQMIRVAHHAGYQVGVHATGDRSIDVAVDEVAQAMAEVRGELRHYIIHGDLVSAATLRRMAENGMGWNVQPSIAVTTRDWLAGALGDDAARAAWPLAAAHQAGVNVCLSSDAPVISPDWRQGIADADAWMGSVPDAAAREQRMLELLRGYTVNPARQDGAESWKGSLELGKVADLCVLAADPLSVTPAELPGVAVDMTVVDGEVVFERVAAELIA